MKNRLNTLWNVPPRNPTQNILRRFAKVPWTSMASAFSRAQDEFEERKKSALKSVYDDIWKDVEEK